MDSFSTTSSSQCDENKCTHWPSSDNLRGCQGNSEEEKGTDSDPRDRIYMTHYLAELEAERDLFMEKFKNGVDYLENWRPIKKAPLIRIQHESESDQQLPLLDRHAKRKKAKRKAPKRHLCQKRRRDEIFLHRYFAELECQREEFVKSLQFEDVCSELGDNTITKEQCLSSFLSDVEVFICNVPLTIGALGLGWVTQGVVWFKFMEENTKDCVPVRFNSPECTYPEFPGCFECNTSNPIYFSVVIFHYFCHLVGFVCCVLFLLRAIFASRAVIDELSNPATSTPMGVVCITMVCVCAGRGQAGEALVVATSVFHFFLALWFLYTAIWKFRLLPDPGWFPNTVGISYAAIKTWLYFPAPGKFLMVFAMLYFFSTFFVSLYRVAVNRKIAAPVCFIQLSAPSITLYSMTIMAQASPQREQVIETSPAELERFYAIHHSEYIPMQHAMMLLSLIGMVSVLHSLWARWPVFKHKEFSPAHMAFVFPLLSHTNAIQAYRSGVDSFSGIPEGSPFKVVLFAYWFTCLIVGTAVNMVFTVKYLRRLPAWTRVRALGDKPVARPGENVVQELLSGCDVREPMNATFSNTALLQANETGVLMRIRRDSEDFRTFGPFVRTRQVASLGFDLMMTEEELRQERTQLLDWVAHNAPKTRKKTVSVPDLAFVIPDLESYGTFAGERTRETGHKRASTLQ